MKKYKVKLATEYNSSAPFITNWDYEMIGDVLRAEFDEYFERMEKEGGIVKGGTKKLFKGEELKGFMIRKKINLVNDDSNNMLKSVFVLNVGEEKIIDERARKSLSRYEKRRITRSDGTSGSWLGFLEFKEIKDGNDTIEKGKQIQGKDIEYFEEEKKEEEKFICGVCGKEFKTKKALSGHKMSHSKK